MALTCFRKERSNPLRPVDRPGLEKADRCPVSNRKRDIEGSVESVAEEVASFWSDVTIIEPGGARIAKLMLIDTQIPAHSFLRMVGPKNGLAPR
jgi:hypothetical protein